jgi:hypothetical protein
LIAASELFDNSSRSSMEMMFKEFRGGKKNNSHHNVSARKEETLTKH